MWGISFCSFELADMVAAQETPFSPLRLPLPNTDQLSLLRARNLAIGDERAALEALKCSRQPCVEPDPPTDRTLGGLVQSMRDYQTAIDFCNAQLDALRSFFKNR
jgi:hypothetical protein